MKKSYPVVFAIITILFLGIIIAKNQWHLHNSRSIYIALAPVDPRSLIQGDYMILSYNLGFSNHLYAEKTTKKFIFNQSHVPAYVQLDEQNRVIATTFQASTFPNAQKLMLKNPNNNLQQLYPAANSFLFAEGLAQCYEQAKFAEFKVDHNGKAILVSLRAEDLNALNCEQQAKWHEGQQQLPPDL